MAMEAQDIERVLRETFPNAEITLSDLTGGRDHYALEISDESFRGLNRVQQQRAVFVALQGKITIGSGPNTDIHALPMTTKAPE